MKVTIDGDVNPGRCPMCGGHASMLRSGVWLCREPEKLCPISWHQKNDGEKYIKGIIDAIVRFT